MESDNVINIWTLSIVQKYFVRNQIHLNEQNVKSSNLNKYLL